jgi:peptidoglycan L-alanyl-D-glutamate endopeptidase CwlK
VASEISLLVPDFRKQLIRSLTKAREQKLIIEVLSTVVSPLEQASLWKQGRSRTDGELKVLALENAGALYLADCMRHAQPQGTNVVTDILPGMSWHQWGEAASIVWVDGTNRLNWSSHFQRGGFNGYQTFASILNEYSIVSGGEFEDTNEAWREVQLRHDRYPSDLYDIVQIDAEMRKRFGR